MFDFGYITVWRLKVPHKDAMLLVERAAETEDVKGDDYGKKIVCGIALRPLSDDESEGTRVFAYLELGKKSLWSILGKETTKRLVPLWLEAFKMAARERYQEKKLG